MRAVRTLSGQVHVVDVPMPQGDGIRVRIRSAGICSSDLHLIAAGWPITSTLGHEMAGELSDGTRVAIEPIAPCGHCDSCTRGEYSVCRRGAGMIYGVSHDGGMADEIIVPSRCLVRLPDGVPTSNACLVEPLAVALHGLRRVPLDPREPIAIVGAGSLGLCTAAMAKPYVSGVTLFARHDAQREAALRLGTQVDVTGEFPVVVDCAGTNEAMAHCVSLCRPGGTILMLATYWQGLTVPAFEIGMKSLRLVASSLYDQCGLSRDVDVAAAAMAANPTIANAIITHRFPIDAAREAFQMAGDRAAGAIKVVLEP